MQTGHRGHMYKVLNNALQANDGCACYMHLATDPKLKNHLNISLIKIRHLLDPSRCVKKNSPSLPFSSIIAETKQTNCSDFAFDFQKVVFISRLKKERQKKTHV